jgi:hypothetical protein
MLFNTDELSKYICRRIYSFFIYNEIDEVVEKNVILPLAAIFKSSNYEIQPVLKTLLSSAHFFDELIMGVMIKNPVDCVIGMWRTLGISPGTSDLSSLYQVYKKLHANLTQLGLEIGDPPNVGGWPAYYQAPQFDRVWISTSTITLRGRVSDEFINHGFSVTPTIIIRVDCIAFTKTLKDPGNPTNLIMDVARLVTGYDLSPKAIDELKAILLSGQQSDYYWTAAWNNYLLAPTTENKGIVQSRLQNLFQRMFQLGEFQLM